MLAVLGTATVIALIDGTAADAGPVFWILPGILVGTLCFWAFELNRYTVTETHLIVRGLVFRRKTALSEIDYISYRPTLQYVTIRAQGKYFVSFSSSWFYGLSEMLGSIQARSNCDVSPALQTKLNLWRKAQND